MNCLHVLQTSARRREVNWRHFPIAICVVLMMLMPVAWGQSSPAPASQGGAPKPAGAGAPSDIDKVEKVLASRREYQASLEQLRQHYIATGDAERTRWVEDELTHYHRHPKQAYRLELDVPPPTLQGLQNIDEANKLYRTALSYKENSGIPWSSRYMDNQSRAELLFQQLLSNYPQSDKIDDAAYQLGQIYEGKRVQTIPPGGSVLRTLLPMEPKNTSGCPSLRSPALRQESSGTHAGNRAVSRDRHSRNRPQTH